jgi:hypothetical protein
MEYMNVFFEFEKEIVSRLMNRGLFTVMGR